MTHNPVSGIPIVPPDERGIELANNKWGAEHGVHMCWACYGEGCGSCLNGARAIGEYREHSKKDGRFGWYDYKWVSEIVAKKTP